MSILIIVNNYLHDVATAMLLSSALIVWVLGRQAAGQGEEARRLFASALTPLSWIALGALVWIVVGGIPRVIFFTRYEWDPAVVRGIVPALVLKHALMVAAIAAGSVLWARMRRIAHGSPKVA